MLFPSKKFKISISNLTRSYIYIHKSTRPLYIFRSTNNILHIIHHCITFTSPITFTSSQVRSHYIHKSDNIQKSDQIPFTSQINGLSLAFPTHEDVSTEDSYLSQTMGHGKCLWHAQSSPLWSCKGRRQGPRGCHLCVDHFSHLSHLATTRKQV